MQSIQILGIALATLLPIYARAESKYTAPFEKYAATKDIQGLRDDLRAIAQKPINYGEDVDELVKVLTSPTLDSNGFDVATTELLMIAAGALSFPDDTVTDVFQHALDAFKQHLREALSDQTSKWAFTLVAVTAFPGVQPDEDTAELLYRFAESKAPEPQRSVALLGLARIRPLPIRARDTILSDTRTLTPDARLGIWGYALADPEIHAQFVKSLSGDNVAEQRVATRVLARTADCHAALADLRALKSQAALDQTVATNVQRGLDRCGDKSQ